MKYVVALLSFCLACFSPDMAVADNDNAWKLRRDRDGIQVYTQKVAGSPYAAVRSIMVLHDVRLASMVALLEDVEACPDWADKCAEAYVYERISDTESYVYTHNSMPFPIKDRDVLSHVRWSQDAVSLVVEMRSDAVTGVIDKVKRRVRLTKADILWQFTPLESGSVEVVNEAHIDPGSSLPGWITNMLLVDTPYRTIKSFAAEVVKDKYRNASIDFIVEPPKSSIVDQDKVLTIE